MNTHYHGKVALITCAGRGIGPDIAAAFAKNGASVLLTGREEGPLKATCQTLAQTYGADVHYLVTDGTRESRAKEAAAWASDRYGRVDVLINNAWTDIRDTALENQTRDAFELAVNAGFYGVFFYMKACFPYLKESKGSIINICPAADRPDTPGRSAAAAVREAVCGLTRMAAEWNRYGINTNAICTGLQSGSRENAPSAEVHVGGTCLFLGSPAGKYISGRTLEVDG